MSLPQKSLSGKDSTSTITLGHLPIIVGRGSDCDVRLCDPWVSRHHCEINQSDGRLVILDLDSKHGTYVNKRRVQCDDLLPGDTLSLGMTRLVVGAGGRSLRIMSSGGETTVSDLFGSEIRS
jgi:pSer/pThr/pTyr-binding forkhead associated (FHA) protein